MRKIIKILITGLLLMGCSKVADINPASDGLFIRYFGNSDSDGFTDAGSMVVNGSEIVVVGTIFNEENYTRDIYLFKTDLIGKIITENMIDFNDYENMEYGRDIKVAPAGGYYILAEKDTSSNKDLLVLKVNNNLEEEWSEALPSLLGEDVNENAKALCVQEDGGLAILGEYTDGSGTLRSFLYVYYYDGSKPSWAKEFFTKDINAGRSLLIQGDQVENYRYSFPGTENNYGGGNDSRAILLRTNNTGLPEDPVNLGRKNIGIDHLLFGGEFVMLSNNYEDNVPDSISVFRIDSKDLSVYIEEKIGPDNLEGRSIASTPNGYIITGDVVNGTDKDICLIKTDHNIKPLWKNDMHPTYKSYGGDGEDYGVKVAALDDGYVILGISQVAGLRMITLIRTDLEGNLITN